MEKNKTKTAFTFIELALVITIVGIIIAILVPSYNNFSNNYKTKLTNERIKIIYNALGNYARSNKHLPCPASMLYINSDANYGISENCLIASPSGNGKIWYSASSQHNNLWYGMVPVKTLGLNPEVANDGFGNRFAYAVLRGYADPNYFGSDDNSTFTGTGYNYNYGSPGNSYIGLLGMDRIRILEANAKLSGSGVTAKIVTDEAIFIIISYGPNGSGAWKPNSASPNSFPISVNEQGNAVSYSNNGLAAQNYYSSNFFLYSTNYNLLRSAVLETYPPDDILFFKTIDQFVTDFNLFDLIPCDKPTNSFYPINTTSLSAYFYWTTGTNVKFNNVVYPSPSCPAGIRHKSSYPSKLCGAYGSYATYIFDGCT